MRVGNAMENKENARPWEGGGGGGGGAEYREDYANESDRVAAKLARKESLNIKLALRPDRQELINRYTHSFGNQHGLPMFSGWLPISSDTKHYSTVILSVLYCGNTWICACVLN